MELMALETPTIEEAGELLKLALAEPHEVVEPATKEQIVEHLNFLWSTLPGRASDMDSGRRKAAVYIRMLRDYSNDALAWMALEALKTFDWMPTPSQCLALLKRYKTGPSLKYRAETAARKMLGAIANQIRDDLRFTAVAQDRIDNLPEGWKRIFNTEGLLREIEHGKFIQAKVPQ